MRHACSGCATHDGPAAGRVRSTQLAHDIQQLGAQLSGLGSQRHLACLPGSALAVKARQVGRMLLLQPLVQLALPLPELVLALQQGLAERQAAGAMVGVQPTLSRVGHGVEISRCSMNLF